ncbi:hypothetical protein Leryth_023238 [Lithospermum erythrorhizon]|nr:hypothetical protein Leryth_023238 [Lithospermum erythrorhizon]
MSFLPMEDVVRTSLLLLGGNLSGKLLVASIFVSMTYSELLLNKKSVYRREPYSDMTYSQNLDNWVATGIALNVKNFRIGGYSGYLSDNESINSKFRLLIRTPALKSFSIDGTSVGFQSLESLNLLYKAKITLESYDGDESSLYLHLIEAIHPVKLLHLDASAFRVVGHLPLYKRFLHN